MHIAPDHEDWIMNGLNAMSDGLLSIVPAIDVIQIEDLAVTLEITTELSVTLVELTELEVTLDVF
jgi:hypothetical protein